ncbi:MAG TPA: hypothetical protein VFB72_04015 [Verrucomicrobiae bacterium]|nr:hypothetical protein [Verrucomicrobiae bacterium]
MSASLYRVRRATVDDLPHLVPLWNSMHLPAGELERRLTEFQIVEADDGGLLGTIGMQIVERHASIHSEAFKDFALADELRAHLWARLQSLAMNHGLTRLWTAEDAPFWKANGFRPAESAELKRLPAAWKSFSGEWLTMALRDEDALHAVLKKDFSNLLAEEQQKRQRVLSRAKTVKQVGITVIVLLVIGILAFCFNMLLHAARFRRH